MEYSEEYVESLKSSAEKMFAALNAAVDGEEHGMTKVEIEGQCVKAIRDYVELERAFSV